MNRIHKKISLFIFVIALLLTMIPNKIQAASYSNYSIKAILPKNQIDPNLSYFDLLIGKNHTQTIEVEITNTGDETMEVSLAINDAFTTNNGVIDYLNQQEHDKSHFLNVYEVTNIIDNNFYIEAHTTKRSAIEINIPDISFDGEILGGIVVRGKTNKALERSEDSLTIQNDIAYVVGLKMRMNHTPVKQNLNLLKIEEKLVDHRPAVIANIQNDQAIIMQDVAIQGSITKANHSDTVAEIMFDSKKIAPNTNFDVVFDFGGKAIANGDYQMNLVITNGDKKWQWKEDFRITNADEINKENLFKEEKTNWFLIIGTSTLIGLFLGASIILIIKKKQKH